MTSATLRKASASFTRVWKLMIEHNTTLWNELKINIDRCSADESGTKMQQIYAATTFTTTKTYNIELKVHRKSSK